MNGADAVECEATAAPPLKAKPRFLQAAAVNESESPGCYQVTVHTDSHPGGLQRDLITLFSMACDLKLKMFYFWKCPFNTFRPWLIKGNWNCTREEHGLWKPSDPSAHSAGS